MKITCFIVCSFALSSCASILNKRYQTVNITTDNDSSRIYVNNELVGTGKNVAFKARRNLIGYQLRVEQDGTYPRYKGIVQIKKSPLYYLSIVPFGPLIIPPAFDVMRKAFDYPKEIQVKSGIKKLYRAPDSKSIVLENIQIALENSNNLFVNYKWYIPDEFPQKTRKLMIATSFFSYNFPWKNELNRVLDDARYFDTTSTDKTNRLYLHAKLKSIHNLYVYKPFNSSYRTPGFFVCVAKIDWEVKDSSDKLWLTKTIESISGEHLLGIFSNTVSVDLMGAYEEAMSYNMIQLIREIEQQDFIRLNE